MDLEKAAGDWHASAFVNLKPSLGRLHKESSALCIPFEAKPTFSFRFQESMQIRLILMYAQGCDSLLSKPAGAS
jgi:hypothetical protein